VIIGRCVLYRIGLKLPLALGAAEQDLVTLMRRLVRRVGVHFHAAHRVSERANVVIVLALMVIVMRHRDVPGHWGPT
jgi:hypothetical protein